MEVHHHTHHPKKWKEYFWEFFMLFLAVFCGFLAEIQVEHYVEHQREKKYMQMYLEDLRSDSVRFLRVIPLNKTRIEGLDKFLDLLNSNVFNDSTTTILYELYTRNSNFTNFIFNTRTLSQLKTAGGYRLIRVKSIADSLIGRDLDVDWNNGIRETLYDGSNEVFSKGVDIFDHYKIHKYRKLQAKTPETAFDSAFLSRATVQKNDSVKFTLITFDKSIIHKFSSTVIRYTRKLFAYNLDLVTYQRKCNSLIKLIKEEYRLE